MINEAYENIIQPQNVRDQFKTTEEFISWLETGSKEDLVCTLLAFEDSEMYEDCNTILNVINSIT